MVGEASRPAMRALVITESLKGGILPPGVRAARERRYPHELDGTPIEIIELDVRVEDAEAAAAALADAILGGLVVGECSRLAIVRTIDVRPDARREIIAPSSLGRDLVCPRRDSNPVTVLRTRERPAVLPRGHQFAYPHDGRPDARRESAPSLDQSRGRKSSQA